jgi:hypothetical protein
MTSPTVDTTDLDLSGKYLNMVPHPKNWKVGIGVPHRDIMRTPACRPASETPRRLRAMWKSSTGWRSFE